MKIRLFQCVIKPEKKKKYECKIRVRVTAWPVEWREPMRNPLPCHRRCRCASYAVWFPSSWSSFAARRHNGCRTCRQSPPSWSSWPATHTSITAYTNYHTASAISLTSHTSINAPMSAVKTYSRNGYLCWQRGRMTVDKHGHVSYHCGPIVLDLLKEDRGRRHYHNTTAIHK